MPNWDKYPNTQKHAQKEREWKWRSVKEAVDLRGDDEGEPWSVEMFLTIAWCHISNTDCLKRTIYIS